MRLSEYLSLKGLADPDFAALVGVNRTSVGRWKSGKRIPSRDAMRKIREATGGAVTADDFFELSTTSRSGGGA